MSGSWLAAFFLVGLLVEMRSLSATRLRYFVLACVFVLAIVQCLGRTQLTDDSPELNSENLLVLLAPLVVLYGTSLFCILLEQVELPFREGRYIVIGLFATITCLPILLVFLPPKGNPVSFPPYYPPALQITAGWTKEDELTMSDLPWAMAWYGQRPCVWLTLNSQSEFLAINDYQKPIQALYLSQQILRSPFADLLVKDEQGWGAFVLNCMVRKGEKLPPVPQDFPLHYLQAAEFKGVAQFILTAREKWPESH